MKPSQAHIVKIQTGLSDFVNEKREELSVAYERIEQLEEALEYAIEIMDSTGTPSDAVARCTATLIGAA